MVTILSVGYDQMWHLRERVTTPPAEGLHLLNAHIDIGLVAEYARNRYRQRPTTARFGRPS